MRQQPRSSSVFQLRNVIDESLSSIVSMISVDAVGIGKAGEVGRWKVPLLLLPTLIVHFF